jgi:hypothetical protein
MDESIMARFPSIELQFDGVVSGSFKLNICHRTETAARLLNQVLIQSTDSTWHPKIRLYRSHSTEVHVMDFKAKLSALMKFIKDHEILGKVSGFVWRIEYQRRGLPHACILFWIDFDTQDIHTVEAVINIRFPTID